MQSVNEIWPVYDILQKAYYKKKKKQWCDLKTSPKYFCVWKELGATSIEKWDFWGKLLVLEIAKLSNLSESAGRPQILFTEDSLKIRKGLELIPRPHFSQNFLMKKCLCSII